ncbi:MAG TPA: TetR family transcriptional regulator C-terminal domain-containing protein [Nocardioidaceae bacterium]|nr:TetR family transcriptional regulator C-terminal domain-containing protein [Nocardioidaceae bacterium]
MTANELRDAGRDLTDQRRDDMLRAAAELIAERGFSETRIADVARRVGASPALVIYYFETKDQLLTAALRHSEDAFYEACARLLAEASSVRDRLEIIVRLTCTPDSSNLPGAWGLWFDLWAQAFRHPQVAKHRVELERRWRKTIADVVHQAVDSREIAPVDADQFAVTWGVLLDGLSIQVALQDEMVDQEVAFDIAMRFAEQALELPAR